MKTRITLLILLVSCIFAHMSLAQSEALVTGVKAEQFKPVVLKVMSDNGYEVFNAYTDIETKWKEYTVNMVMKYRAMISFTFNEGTIKIAFMHKQALLNNGSWGDAAIPSKKADDKMVNTLADGIKKILGDPKELEAVMASSGSAVTSSETQPAGNNAAPVQSNTQNAGNVIPVKVPSTANAKVLQFHPDADYQFHEGFCAIKKHDMWGFIDLQGNTLIDFKYLSSEGIDAPCFSDGIAMMAEPMDGKNVPRYFDSKGQELFKALKLVWGTPFQGGIAMFAKGANVYTASYSFYNKQGQPLPGSVVCGTSIGLKNFPFHEGMAKFQDSKTSGWGFINQQAKWAIPGKYNAVGDFSDGMAPVQNKTNYYWGYINDKGQEVVPFDYKDMPGPFSEGLAAVKNSANDLGYIDKTGKIVIPFEFNGYQFAGPFRNGYAVAERNQGGYMIIDRSGNMVKKLNTTKVHVYNNGWIGWFNEFGDNVTNTWGILTPDGKEVLQPGYFNFIGEFSDGLAWAEAEIDSKEIKGFINEKFDFVIIQATE